MQKKLDCTCAYPTAVARNINGHHPDCPVYKELAAIVLAPTDKHEIDNIRELVADYAHRAWSGWMQYMFLHCTLNDRGDATIPVGVVRRWRRQIETPYEQLPPAEQASALEQADAILSLLHRRRNLNAQQG